MKSRPLPPVPEETTNSSDLMRRSSALCDGPHAKLRCPRRMCCVVQSVGNVTSMRFVHQTLPSASVSLNSKLFTGDSARRSNVNW